MIDFNDLATRRRVIEDIKTNENKKRKYESYKQFECFMGRLRQFVTDYLLSQFTKQTVYTMPIIDSINISSRVVNKQASLYKTPPKRTFTNLDQDQQTTINNWYLEYGVNSKLFKSNQFFKLQDQSFLMLVPDREKNLKCRVVMPHMIDAIPSDVDPEIADAYIISVHDKQWFNHGSDGRNEVTADQDDYKANVEKYLVWTKEINFLMNGRGEFLTEIFPNPIGELPFIDIAEGKDYEFFVRGGQALTDFAIQYCGALSDLAQVVKMQGWSVGWLKGPASLMPEEIIVGPNKILKLTTDPNNPDATTEFGYSSPDADIQGAMSYLEMLISNFLTSRGLDSNIISSKGDAQKFSSGVEKLLSMIDAFEASKQDMDIYQKAERQFFELLKKWNNLLIQTPNKIFDFLIPEDSELEVQYHQPQNIQTTKEKLETIQLRLELGLIDQIDAIAADRDITREAAEQVYIDIQEGLNGQGQDVQTGQTLPGINDTQPQGNVQADGSQSIS
jgi:hypothetical protein